jgi:hypothetical protein
MFNVMGRFSNMNIYLSLNIKDIQTVAHQSPAAETSLSQTNKQKKGHKMRIQQKQDEFRTK